MLYKQLFELNIFHEYYQNQICPDLSIEPTIECSRILRGHRLIIRNKVNGIMVIAPVDSEQKPWVELVDNLRFTFILKIKNKDFMDFTDIDWKPSENSIMYHYENIINQNNNQVKVLALDITHTKFCYLKLPRGQHILAIIDIYNNSSLPKVLHQGSEYKITFKAKKQQWRYYLVTPAVSNGDEFLIKDDNEFLIKDNDEKRQKKIQFIKNTPKDDKEADPIFSVLKQQFPGAEQYRFISEEKITCQEAGIKNIQLLNKNKCTSDKGKVWIKHLPNPPNRNGIQVINALKYL